MSIGHHKPAPPILPVSNLKEMSAEYVEVTVHPVCALVVGLYNYPLSLSVLVVVVVLITHAIHLPKPRIIISNFSTSVLSNQLY